jgi:hypothetical protein
MRPGSLAAVAALLVTAGAFGPSCKIYKDEAGKVPEGYEAGVYPPASGRQVYDDGGLIMGGGGVPGGGGPVVVVGNDGAAPSQDATSGGSPDLGVVAPDAGGGDGAGASCSLLAPACGPNMGCYPSGAGQGRCERSDPGAAEGVQCFEPSNCAPGLSCVSNLCTALCSIAQPICAGLRRCVPYPGYEGVGYCLP